MPYIREYPQDRFSFRLYDNADKLTPEKIREKTGCYGLVNLSYFNMVTYAHDSALMLGGVWACEPQWHEYGICIDKDGKMTLGTEKEAVYDYAVGCPPVVINGRSYNNTYYGKNGATYTGLRADGTVVVMVATKDDGLTSAEAKRLMQEAGCVHIFRWDGSWSSQGIIDPDTVVKASKYRCCRSWLLIFDKAAKEGKQEMDKKKVVLDPGHGVETDGKRSPDGKYLEHEFNLDVAIRMKEQLERHNVEVILTRSTEHEIFPDDDNGSLAARVKISNIAKPALFVSIHSNAYGDGTEWTDPAGYLIYTSAAGDTAGRNKAAKAILARAKAAGIQIHGDGLQHTLYYVLRYTNDPAVLIEHGFHTNIHEVELLKNSAYRDLLAKVDAQGILDYLGIAWQEKAVENAVSCFCPHCGGKLSIVKG